MEVHFTVEQEAQLSHLATFDRKLAEQLVREAALRILDQNVRFREGVQKGLDAANRGDFVEEADMDARIEQMLRSALFVP